MIIVGKIDCTKIEKARLFPGKNGAKYLDVIIKTTDEPDQYGNNGMIVQSVSKEERAQGVRGPILGNVKILKQPDSGRQLPPRVSAPSPDPDKDDVPF